MVLFPSQVTAPGNVFILTFAQPCQRSKLDFGVQISKLEEEPHCSAEMERSYWPSQLGTVLGTPRSSQEENLFAAGCGLGAVVAFPLL